MAHLATLGELAAAGTPAAVVFVVQRSDAEVLDLSAPADAAWVTAVRGAMRAGVEVVAHRCHVTEDELALGPRLPVRS